MVGIESSTNVKTSLEHVKEKYNLRPELVTCDFSPPIIAAVCEVFGEEKLQIDGFHVMQELNNGIRRDLLDYRQNYFQKEVLELFRLRDSVSVLQKQLAKGSPIGRDQNQLIPPVIDSHYYAHQCSRAIKGFLIICSSPDPQTFFKRLKQYLRKLHLTDPALFEGFVQQVQAHYPKHALTEKGRVRLTTQILKKFKTLFLKCRSILEDQSHAFYKDHWTIFFQPEKLTPERKRRLERFLSRYPELREYRDMTVRLGEIYRKNIDAIDGDQIDKLEIKPTYSKKLQAALKTIKKYKSAILRFVKVFKQNPELTKSCRANMEYFNRKFKAPFWHGLNRPSRKHLHTKLELQLGCEVRFLGQTKISPS